MSSDDSVYTSFDQWERENFPKLVARRDRIAAMRDWIEQTGELSRVISVEGGKEANPVPDEALLALADLCEWLEANLGNPKMTEFTHPVGVVVGCGDLLEYCRTAGKSETSRAYFVGAYL